jgi:hypothetical protein
VESDGLIPRAPGTDVIVPVLMRQSNFRARGLDVSTIAYAQPRLLEPPRVAHFCPAANCGRACGPEDCTCRPCRCASCRARRRHGPLTPDVLPALKAAQLRLIPERNLFP